MGSNPIEDTNNNQPRFAYAMIVLTISCREIPNSFYRKVKPLNNNIMTNDKKKIYWMLNWILCAIIFIILAIILYYRYFKVGTPVEDTWLEEVTKYLFMWPALTAVCWVVFWVPFKALSSYIAKKNGATED